VSQPWNKVWNKNNELVYEGELLESKYHNQGVQYNPE
jgi:hypothetical protein